MGGKLSVLFLAAIAGGAVHAAVSLGPPDSRITDQAIHADYETIAAVQNRLQELNDGGRPLGDYHMAKAQCWLDTAFHEYSRNDRSGWPQAALQQSADLAAALEAGLEPSGETPLVASAQRLREDLWARAADLKTHEGYRCARALLACFEVGLVHAGHEYAQYGWRHARSYIEIAEDRLEEATRVADACNSRPLLAEQPIHTEPTPEAVTTGIAPAEPAEKVLLQADALFSFDRFSLPDMSPDGRARLEDLAARLGQAYSRIDLVLITGHTDRLGAEDYNRSLSLERANTVLRYLESLGVTARMVSLGRASAEPLSECDRDLAPREAIISCLAPDRRVEVEIYGQPR
jgi:OmpA-OmpF porin, OOP family